MKLVRFTTDSGPHWGSLDGSRIRMAPPSIGSLEENLADLLQLSEILALEPTGPEISEVQLLAPLYCPPQFIGIGLNYRNHAIETGNPIPASPISFGFLQSSIIGPGESIVIPPNSSDVDWEAELGIVIGKPGRDISIANALDHVAGYVIVNDVSERQIQSSEGQWGRAKSFDSFKPVGPWIVTQSEVGDADNLKIGLTVNGIVKQSSSTSELIFGISELVSRLSYSTSLMTGSIISTGTPPGIGSSRKPPEFLKSGDIVEVTIEKIGSLTNPVVKL